MEKFLVGGAAIAAITACWSYISWAFMYARSHVVTVAELSGDLTLSVLTYCRQHEKKVPIGTRMYNQYNYLMRKTGEVRPALAYSLGSGVLFFEGWRPVWVSSSPTDRGLTGNLVTIRGQKFVEDLLFKAVSEFSEMQHQSGKRFYTKTWRGRGNRVALNTADAPAEIPLEATAISLPGYDSVIVGIDREDIGPCEENFRSIEQLALGEPQEDLLRKFDYWYQSRDWCRDRSIPWKFGMALHGLPGTGKTAFVRALGVKYDLPINRFDLSSMDNAELEAMWNQAKANTPSIFLFEDFDAVFQGRKLVDEKGQLSFDQVLQVTSGVEECDGVVMCLTTNNFESLDPAIIRPGRAEHCVEFGPLSYVQACTLADSIIQNDAWSPGFRKELVQMFKENSKSLTGAFVQKEATRFALAKKFGEFV